MYDYAIIAIVYYDILSAYNPSTIWYWDLNPWLHVYDPLSLSLSFFLSLFLSLSLSLFLSRCSSRTHWNEIESEFMTVSGFSFFLSLLS